MGVWLVIQPQQQGRCILHSHRVVRIFVFKFVLHIGRTGDALSSFVMLDQGWILDLGKDLKLDASVLL